MKLKDLINEAKKITLVDQIRIYTDLSRNLSRTLYKHHVDGTMPPEFIQQDTSGSKDNHHLPTLDIIANKKLPKNMTLYTGIRHNPMDFVDGSGKLHTPAFMSTSTKWSIALKFALRQASRKDNHAENHFESAHILEINAKKGQSAGSLNAKSTEKSENEFLLPRNTILHINPDPEKSKEENRDLYTWICTIKTNS